MSAQEEAARLMQLAQSTYAKGLVQEIIADLASKLQNISDALGQGHSKLDGAMGPIKEVKAHAEQLAVMLDGAFDMLGDVARSIG